MTKLPRIFKTSTIQEKTTRIMGHNGGSKSKNMGHKFKVSWTILPKKIIKSHKWKKGDKLVFIPVEGIIEGKPGDVIIRKLEDGNRKC